jgi:hypothetical protein
VAASLDGDSDWSVGGHCVEPEPPGQNGCRNRTKLPARWRERFSDVQAEEPSPMLRDEAVMTAAWRFVGQVPGGGAGLTFFAPWR